MRVGLLFLLLLLLSQLSFGQSCTLTVSISASSTAICSGTNAILTAQASAGTGPYSYNWSTGETTASISVNKAGTYTVTVSDKTAGCQPVKKDITITSSTTPPAPATSDVAICQGKTATLTATGAGGSFNWYDANGNYLTSGASYTTPPINSQTTFFVETIANGCVSPRSAATVFIYGGPGVSNVGTCYGTAVTLTAAGYTNYSWFDANGTFLANGASFTTPVLTANTTYLVSADINGCTTPRSSATVFVTALPQAPTATQVTICAGSTASLHADAPAGTLEWYDVPSGGTPLIVSPDFTTPPLTADKTYYVQAVTNCTSPRTAVTVTVTPIAEPPTVNPVTAICSGTSTTLNVTSTGATYTWYSRSIGGTAIATGASFTTPALTRTTTYYVDASNGACGSARTAVRVPVTAAPDAPTAEDAVICSGSSATLIATDPGGTYSWYTAATGGSPIFTGDTFVTPPLTTATTYYVETMATAGCISARTPVNVSILPATTPPTAPGTTICSGSAATLTASGANNYQWFDAATGGNQLSNAQVFVTPALTATTTYYVQTTGNCPSSRTAVTVSVTPLPSAPVLSGTTSVCTGTAATLNATASGTVRWYDAVTGGNLLHTGSVYTTPSISQTTTYYADNTQGSCTSARTGITVNNTTGANPQFQYPSGTVCTGTGNITPVINNPAGGTFSASPAGLVFANITTGEINVSASAAGTYTISFLNNGACPAISTAKFTIGTSNDATFTYAPSTFCQGAANPSPTFPGAYSAGVFTASPAGLVFVDTSTGEIDLTKSTPGTYTISNTIAAGGTCAVNVNSVTVTIFPKVIVDAGPSQQVGTGVPVQLNGSITGGTTSGTWSGGTGTFSNASALNAIYTPGPGETTATLTLTSSDPPGPCGAQAASTTITISANPGAPTAAGTTICSGSTATLSATAPGGSYQWYSTASGGSAVASGQTFTTPVLTATTNYYVSTIINGAESGRTMVTVTVTPPPILPLVTAPGVCAGSHAVLTIDNPQAGYVYQWYNVPTGGTALAAGTSYTTRRLSADAVYYVAAVNNGCTSARTTVNVKVAPVPTITSADADQVCSGNPLNYTITADVSPAAFLWSRAAVAGISNPAVTGQTTSAITETLINTTAVPIDVVYAITATNTAANNGCSSASYNYTVTVYPTPTVTSAASATICNGTSPAYSVAFSASQTSFTWSRAAVAGISNLPVIGQTAGTIREILFNTTNAPVDVTYVYSYNTGPCAGAPFTYVVTVNPAVNITSSPTGSACSGIPENYVIQSNVPSATFVWSRAATPGVQEGAVSNQTSGTINETLTNTGTSPVTVVYTIVPTAYNCPGGAFNYFVRVNPIPPVPVANGNSPVCVNSTIQLRTATVAGASYLWTGPSEYTSTDQNPDIPNVTPARAGAYTLTITVNGCSSTSLPVNIVVDDLPVANAGPDQTVCISTTSVQLDGDIHGGTTTGIWSTGGTGTFTPSAGTLKGQYIPSAEDKAAGKVTLTLVSTSKDDCTVASDQMVISFNVVPATDAGLPQTVCAQTTAVQLAGKVFIPGGITWKTAGDGKFSNPADLNATYSPGPNDVAAGKAVLSLFANANDPCYINNSQVTITFNPPPTITMPAVRYVLKGSTITLNPTVNYPNVTYLWSPNVNIDNVTAQNPVITGDRDTTYLLTVTDALGCVSTSSVRIVVSPKITVPNTFTPNGDGVNDTWDIVGLTAYEHADVSIYNRNGAILMHTIGYGIPWDGKYNGQPVPVGVYYYKIDLHVDSKVIAGSLTVLR